MHKTIEWILEKKGEIEAILASFEGIVEMGGYLRTAFNIQGLNKEKYLKDKSVVEVKIFNKSGDIIGDQSNTATRTGYIIVEANDYNTIKDKLTIMYNNYEFKVEG